MTVIIPTKPTVQRQVVERRPRKGMHSVRKERPVAVFADRIIRNHVSASEGTFKGVEGQSISKASHTDLRILECGSTPSLAGVERLEARQMLSYVDQPIVFQDQQSAEAALKVEVISMSGMEGDNSPGVPDSRNSAKNLPET